MSLPTFPTISPSLSREDAINQIISSIAMEELGLSHIINAEGEKLQYVLGTLPGQSGASPGPTVKEVLEVNESVRSVLQSAAENQTLLRSKLQSALTSATMTGPTGPTGPAGGVTPGVDLFTINAQDETKKIIAADELKFESETLDITVEDGPVMKLETKGGTIIPLASATEQSLTTDGATGHRKYVSVVGFGLSSIVEAQATDPITLLEDAQFAFQMPVSGTVTALSAFFTATSTTGITDQNTTVTAKIYYSDKPDTVYNLLHADATVKLVFEGAITAPTTKQGFSVPLSIPVEAGTKLLIVFDCDTAPFTGEVVLRGYFGGGLLIK